MAEIFDASGVGGGGSGFDFGRAIDSAVSAVKDAAKDLTQSAHDLTRAAIHVGGMGGKGMAGVGSGASGANMALPVAQRIPRANPVLPGRGTGTPGGGIPAIPTVGVPPIPGGGSVAASAGGVGLAGVAGPLLAAAAGAAAFAAAVTGAVAAARHFGELVSPAAAQAFDAAMRDLGAVVGTFLMPILQEATRFVREFAAYLYPIVTQSLPGFQSIIRSVSEVWVGILPIVASIAGAFASLLEPVAMLTRLWADVMLPIWRSISAVVAGLAAGFKAVLSSVMQLFGGNLRTAFKSLGEVVGLTVVALAGLFFQLTGMTEALNGMMNDLKNGPAKQDATGLAVARNARYTDPGGLGKEIAARAFVSSGREGMTKPNDDQAEFRKNAVLLLDQINNGGPVYDRIADAFFRGAVKAAASAIPSPTDVLEKSGDVMSPGNFILKNVFGMEIF